MATFLQEIIRTYRADLSAVCWGISCCWLVVWGNYAMLELNVTVFYLIPIDLFGVPILVTVLFHLVGVVTRPD